LSHNNEMKV